MPWARAGIVVVLVATACSAGGRDRAISESSTQTGADASVAGPVTVDSTPVTVDSGPILGVVTAHDVDEHGVPVEPALEFASDATQMSVVVLVGEVDAGSRLEVAWTWLDGPDGEQPLFEHQIDAGSGDVAYSHGIATGPLAAGRYRADVSVGASTTGTLFAVRPEPITFPELASGFARQQQSSEPAPPSSGPSGTIPAPHATSTNGVCQPWVQLSSLIAMTGADRCGDNEFEVTAWVGDNPPVGYGRWIGDFIKPVQADPCDLGGSDLETKPVSYAVTVIAGPDVGKLFRKTGSAPEPDTEAPLAFLGSEPRPGGQVSEGDTIVVEITADDRTSVDSIVSGIASVTLATDTGQQVDGWEFEGPVACDKDRLRRVVRLEYLVPENPPELVKLIATVKDYEGHETKVEATYPTVGLWTGYMDVIGGNTIETPDNSFRCTTEWEFRVVLFAPATGDVYGYAEGVPGTQECMSEAQPQFTRLDLTGTMTTDLLTLHFEYKIGGWYGILVLYTAPASDVTLTRSGNIAYGDISLSRTEVGDFTDTHDLTGRIDLGCEAC